MKKNKIFRVEDYTDIFQLSSFVEKHDGIIIETRLFNKAILIIVEYYE